jgi:antitoxin HicB
MRIDEYSIKLKIERLPEGPYLAISDDLPGLVAQGRTVQETIEIARDVAHKLLESYEEHGEALPATVSPIEGPRTFDVAVSV